MRTKAFETSLSALGTVLLGNCSLFVSSSLPHRRLALLASLSLFQLFEQLKYLHFRVLYLFLSFAAELSTALLVALPRFSICHSFVRASTVVEHVLLSLPRRAEFKERESTSKECRQRGIA